MMNQTAIEQYLNQLPNSEIYTDLTEEARVKVVFGAWQALKRNFGEDVLTDEMAALQIIYYLEGEAEEFAKYRRMGVKQVTTKDVSFQLDTTLGAISPEVIGMIEAVKGAADGELPPFFGRLI